MMTLLLALGTAIFPQVSHSCGVRVVHEFVKHAKVPKANSKIDLRVNIFGIINDLDSLQDYQLKSYHPLGVPLQRSYAVEIH